MERIKHKEIKEKMKKFYKDKYNIEVSNQD
jgi:hypothetical protein